MRAASIVQGVVDRDVFLRLSTQLGLATGRCHAGPATWLVDSIDSATHDARTSVFDADLVGVDGAAVIVASRATPAKLAEAKTRLDIHAARIVDAHMLADGSLLALELAADGKRRQVLATGFVTESAGFPPTDLLGRYVAYLANIKPKPFRDLGLDSAGMLLGTEDEHEVGFASINHRSGSSRRANWLVSRDGSTALLGCWATDGFHPFRLEFGPRAVGTPIV